MTQMVTRLRKLARKSFHISFLTRVEAKSQFSQRVMRMQKNGTIAFISDNANPGMNPLYVFPRLTNWFRIRMLAK